MTDVMEFPDPNAVILRLAEIAILAGQSLASTVGVLPACKYFATGEVRDALIAFMTANAEAQAVASKEAQKAGIAAARANPKTYRGRKPSYDRATFETVIGLLDQGAGASIAAATGVSRQAILRIRDDRSGAETALALWGL